MMLKTRWGSISKKEYRHRSARVIMLLSAALIIAVLLTTGAADAAGDSEVSVSPENSTIDVNGTETFEVVVENASDGVIAFEMGLSTSDNSTLDFIDAHPAYGNERTTFDSDFGPNNDTVDISGLILSDERTNLTGSPTIFTVTVKGENYGNSNISIDPYKNKNITVADSDTETYNIIGTNPAKITVADSTSFEVSNLTAPETVTQGDNITVSADITNSGGLEATQSVAFEIDGLGEVASENVTLAGGASQTVEFTVSTSGIEAGNYTHGIYTDGSKQTAGIEVMSQSDTMDTTVSVNGPSSSVLGTTADYKIIVDSADNGVGSFSLSTSLSNGSVANITDISIEGTGGFTETTIGNDNSSASAEVATRQGIDGPGSVAIVTVTVEADSPGTTDIDADIEEGSLADPNNNLYTVTGINATTLEVSNQPEPASFEVSNLTAPETVTQGDNVTVSADITNSGGLEATQSVAFEIDGLGEVASENVTLAGGASQTVEFTVSTSGIEAGNYTHGVFTADDNATATIEIETVVTIGDSDPAADLDGDGLFEDVNGDGNFNVVDVSVLFENRNSDAVQNNQDLFNFDGQGSFTVVDVSELFDEATN